MHAMMPIRLRRICLVLLVPPLLWACASKEEVRLSALHHFERGNEAFKVEDYPGAVRHYRTAVELDKRSPDIWYNLGLALYEAGNYEDAIEALETSLALDPKRPETHYNLALAYHRSYDRDSAHSHYNAYQDMTRVQDAPANGTARNPAAGGAGGTGAIGAAPAGNAAGTGRAANGTPAAARNANSGQAASEAGRSERAGVDRGTAPAGTAANSQRQQATQTQQPPRSRQPTAAGQTQTRQSAQGAARNGRTNSLEGDEQWWKADLPQR
jgi:tetratricopeptide (TPR) repeat protein